MVVIRTPSCAKQLRLREYRKNLARHQLVAQSGVETFNDPVLPRRTWIDVQRVSSAFFAPLFHYIRNELASIVAANIFWRATYCGQFIKHHNHIVRLKFARHFKRNIFPRVFIEHHQYLDWYSIAGSIKNKICAPHLVLARRLLVVNARFRGSNSSLFFWYL